MVFITTQNNWILPLLVIIFWMVMYDKKRGKIAFILIIITILIVDITTAQIIKPWVGRIRPSHAMTEGINLLVKRGGYYSFFSNHAANTFALATVLRYFYGSKLNWLFFLAGCIAYSRVYVGVHYPADIIFGALYGYSISWIILTLWVIIKMRELKKKRTWTWYHPGDNS